MSTAQETEDYLKKATDLKVSGNDHFRAGRFDKALGCYTKMFAWINCLNATLPVEAGQLNVKGPETVTPEMAKQIQEVRLVANCNCATCYLKLKDAKRALQFCEKALEIDGNHFKTIYRRGQAYLALGELLQAKQDLTAARKAFPKDASVTADLNTLAIKMGEQTEQQRKHWAGAFDKLKVHSPSAKQATSTPSPATADRSEPSTDTTVPGSSASSVADRGATAASPMTCTDGCCEH